MTAKEFMRRHKNATPLKIVKDWADWLRRRHTEAVKEFMGHKRIQVFLFNAARTIAHTDKFKRFLERNLKRNGY
jgi:hypothetical protein